MGVLVNRVFSTRPWGRAEVTTSSFQKNKIYNLTVPRNQIVNDQKTHIGKLSRNIPQKQRTTLATMAISCQEGGRRQRGAASAPLTKVGNSSKKRGVVRLFCGPPDFYTIL